MSVFELSDKLALQAELEKNFLYCFVHFHYFEITCKVRTRWCKCSNQINQKTKRELKLYNAIC